MAHMHARMLLYCNRVRRGDAMAHGSYDDYGGDNEVRTHARTRENDFTHFMSTASTWTKDKIEKI